MSNRKVVAGPMTSIDTDIFNRLKLADFHSKHAAQDARDAQLMLEPEQDLSDCITPEQDPDGYQWGDIDFYGTVA